MPRTPRPRLRPEQEDIVFKYAGGKIGIAAVPGSGKTFTLAHLAARLIADRRVGAEQEVLVVTFTNSAVNSFQARIGATLRDAYGLPDWAGYRVRTLHGLAHDIVRERPSLVGLSDDFTILDERITRAIQGDIVANLFAGWRDRLGTYIAPDGDLKNGLRYLERDLPNIVISFISRAKDLRLEPYELQDALDDLDDTFDLARFATQTYTEYQRSLSYRGAVDFDDLVRLALVALETDVRYLQRLRERWPYVLEDEAQDSSRLQEEMLHLLSGDCNWVRVGDPNQAINTTFTTADPRFLLDFLARDDVMERPLSVSGRSAAPIIGAANELVRWVVEEHPTPDLRDAFEYSAHDRHGLRRGTIQPTVPGDPQPNPPDEACQIVMQVVAGQKITPDQELKLVIEGADYALIPWLETIAELPQEERPTVAVLVPENTRGFKVAELLRRHGVTSFEELLRSTTVTRETVSLLHTVLDYLWEPADLRKLKKLFWKLLPPDQRDIVQGDVAVRDVMTKLFARWRNLEDFLWPATHTVPPEIDALEEEFAWLEQSLREFRPRVQRWLKAVSLPVDQLVLTVGQDIFTDAVDIALVHKVAVVLRGMANAHPEWRLPQFVDELRVISENQRRFIGFDDAEMGYELKPGVVTIATMHAAKGLEWDRVYLMAISNYGFPSVAPYDTFIGEKWYTRGSFSGLVGNLNLQAELLAQLEAVAAHRSDSYVEGDATFQARIDYAKERLRLLYVGITRARRELIVTWNMGRYWHRGSGFEHQPALPIVRLAEYLS